MLSANINLVTVASEMQLVCPKVSKNVDRSANLILLGKYINQLVCTNLMTSSSNSSGSWTTIGGFLCIINNSLCPNILTGVWSSNPGWTEVLTLSSSPVFNVHGLHCKNNGHCISTSDWRKGFS